MIGETDWPRNQPLQLEGVTIRRATTEILKGVNLTFEPGRRYVLIGASGSGKSTLLRLLNRLDDPDSGELRVGTIDLKKIPVRVLRSSVGLVFQAPRPLSGSLLDNLAYPYQVRGQVVPEPSSFVRALEEVGLDPTWLERDASALSGGERQRLAIATALGLEPEILVLDEPTSALDPASARKIAELLSRRAESGLRTIIVTHNREQAGRLGDWTVRLEAGRIVDEGPTAEVLLRADDTVWTSKN